MANTILLKKNSTAGAAPTTAQLQLGELAVNTADGKLYTKKNNGADAIVEIGPSLAYRGVDFAGVASAAPIDDFTYDIYSQKFSQGQSQSVVAFLKVPNTYQGNQIKMRLGHFTPAVANNFKFQAVTTLIRKNTDAITSTTNQYTSTNTDQAISATANQYLEVLYDLTDSSGKINNVAVSAGDLIKVVLTRSTPSGTETASDVFIVPELAEVLFS